MVDQLVRIITYLRFDVSKKWGFGWSASSSSATARAACGMDFTIASRRYRTSGGRIPASSVIAEKAAQGGYYTRDQIHNLELGNLVLDVDAATGQARVGVQLQETSDLTNPDWQPVDVQVGDLDVGSDGTVGIRAPAGVAAEVGMRSRMRFSRRLDFLPAKMAYCPRFSVRGCCSERSVWATRMAERIQKCA